MIHRVCCRTKYIEWENNEVANTLSRISSNHVVLQLESFIYLWLQEDAKNIPNI